MSEFPADIRMVADGIAADIPSTVRKGNRPFISNVIARAIMAERAALSSAAVAEREPVAFPECVLGLIDGRITLAFETSYDAQVGFEMIERIISTPPTSELEAENARLKAELDCALIREGNEKHHAKIAHQNMNAEINARERTEARLAEAMKALEPFAEIAGEAWADGSGWTNAACQNDRICDWFGPSAFHAARRVREGGKVDD